MWLSRRIEVSEHLPVRGAGLSNPPAAASHGDGTYALPALVGTAGVAEGRLIGGNLSVLSALVGTPYAAEIENHLVFLEDIREPPYRIDRMLTQLQQSVGKRGERDGLKRAAGIMLGVFSRSRPTDGDASLTLDELLDDHFTALPIPAVVGYSFGHIAHQFTIPIGVRARLDTASQTLTLLEPAVLG